MHKEINQELLADFLKDLQLGGKLSRLAYKKGFSLYEDGNCSLMMSGINEFEYLVEDDYNDFKTKIKFAEKNVSYECSCASSVVCAHVFAASLQTQQELNRIFQSEIAGSVIYSREGMMVRVLEERKEKSLAEKYHIDFADNIHGEHQLHAESGNTYFLSFYDFEKKLGYCSCPDYQTNKLETCKHLMFAFDYFATQYNVEQLPAQTYPFLEIFRHPLKNYQIAWFFPHKPEAEISTILSEFFDAEQVYLKNKLDELHVFLEKIQSFKLVKIRSEVKKYIAGYFEAKSLQEQFEKLNIPDGLLHRNLFAYQREAALFIGGRKGAILADEIGLGKSAEALSAAMLKIDFLGFSKVRILCPDHLISHWEREIELWVSEAYRECFFLESFNEISLKSSVDFLIIDEAQKIDYYESGIVKKLHQIDFKHILLITDSTVESSLIKYYTMASLIDQHLLTPLWELSYKHCLYDAHDASKILGYHHLDIVNQRLEGVYLRRSRTEVASQLPRADVVKIPVALSKELLSEQSYTAGKILQYAKKDQLNQFEVLQLRNGLQQLFRLSQWTRTLEINEQTTPKMLEFMHFISYKLILKEDEKVLIFVSSASIQNQILRFLTQERKSAAIWKSPHQTEQFLLLAEQFQAELPKASHYVYYHLPTEVELLAERVKRESEALEGIHQKRFYLFCSSNSMESWLYDWSKTKPHFLKQLNRFVNESSGVADLSLRLKEELIYELKSMLAGKAELPLKNYQISLFETNTVAEAGELIKEQDGNGDGSLHSFFSTFIEGVKKFNDLSPAQKNAFLSGRFEVTEKEGEFTVKIKTKP